MPYVAPVIMDRMVPPEWNSQPVTHQLQRPPPPRLIERCEEVRHRLVRLMRAMTAEMEGGAAAYAGELAELVKIGAQDPYAEVCMEVCRIGEFLSAELGRRLTQGHMGKHLVAALAPLTTHQRAPVRAAAALAVGVLVMDGAHEMILEICAFIDPNYVPIRAFYDGEVKVNYLGKLATDASPLVRAALLDRCIGPWMTAMVERKDHESRLMPYLMSALHDEDPTVAR